MAHESTGEETIRLETKTIGILKHVRGACQGELEFRYLSDLFRRPIQTSAGHGAERPQRINLLAPKGYGLRFDATRDE